MLDFAVNSVLLKRGAAAAAGREDTAADPAALLTLVGRLERELQEARVERARLASCVAHLDEQIRLAGQVQRELLPERVEFEGLEIHTLFRPADRVSGDLYDFARLDETHLGISLADATGHGVPAALLSVLLRRSLRGKDILNESYRIVPPVEVLDRVNADVLAAELSDCQFVTGLHAVYDRSVGTLTFARGGSPYPILIRRGAAPKQLFSAGPVLGAMDDPLFESMTVYLEPGDLVLFYTDGLEALLLNRMGAMPFDSIVQTPWFAGLASGDIEASFSRVAERLAGTKPDTWPADDVTMLGLRVG